MAKTEHQKIKILYVLDYLQRKSDETHTVKTEDILAYLADMGVHAECKSIYRDVAILEEYGYQIEHSSRGYRLINRDFELPELKTLVDAVQSCKFISEKKSCQLIEKLEKLTSENEAQSLRHQVFVTTRIKTDNEAIYYTVDCIHNAIAKNKKIRFQYLEWTTDKKEILRHDGQFYTVAPIALIWSDDNYYLLGKDGDVRKHFRADKIRKADLTEEDRGLTQEELRIDIAQYENRTFGMFGGTESRVTLKCDNSLIGVILDRFGSDIMIMKGNGYFQTTVPVMVSPTFISWVCGFGSHMEVVGPRDVRQKVIDTVREIAAKYE